MNIELQILDPDMMQRKFSRYARKEKKITPPKLGAEEALHKQPKMPELNTGKNLQNKHGKIVPS
jgi:hypothetical protein